MMSLVAVQEGRAVRRRLVVWPHHPDVLKLGAAASPSISQALTWNVFRTLELMPPPFWLRRLNACLGLDPPRPAPVTARVHLWRRLRVAPAAIEPQRARVDADVVIETEYGLWALAVCHAGDVAPQVHDTAPDALAALAHAASWRAGRRDCWVGLIVAALDEAPLATALVRRYRASHGALRLRLPPRGPDIDNLVGVGMATWPQLVTILRDAANAGTLDALDREKARRAVEWCDRQSG